MKIIDGRNPAMASLRLHSTFTWFITVPMMSEKPITKNPARMGRMTYFFMFCSLSWVGTVYPFSPSHSRVFSLFMLDFGKKLMYNKRRRRK